MTDAPLDLSLLAQLTPEPAPDAPPDAAPQLPPHETPNYAATSPEREPPAPRAPGPSRPRRGETRAQRERATGKPGAPATPDDVRRFVRDDKAEYKPGILVKPLSDLYTTAGTLTLPFNQPVGTSLVQNAEACAIAWDNAARTDPRIRKALMALLAGSVWGQLIAAHMPILMTLAASTQIGREQLEKMARQTPGPPAQGPDEESATVNPLSREPRRARR